MSEESSELSGAECDRRAEEFASLTSTDEACAHFFLQDCGWDLQVFHNICPQRLASLMTFPVAVNRFFEQCGAAEPNDDNDTRVVKRKALDDGASSSAKRVHTDECGTNTKETVKSFKLLTWNIDGMEPKGLETRTKAVCTIIIVEKPDVVHLQEVSEAAEKIIGGYLGDQFSIHSARCEIALEPYYTLSLVRRSVVAVESARVTVFPTSAMGRSVLVLHASVGGRPVALLNTHSESMAAHKEERNRQHAECFALLLSQGEPGILAGDLNARDADLGALDDAAELVDVWEELGKRKFTQYTWDAAKNDNISTAGRYKPRCRFDRVMYKGRGQLKAAAMSLVGTQRIKTTLSFPSDHFGLLVTFNFL